MERRDFIKMMTSSAAASVWPNRTRAGGKRVNIILIMADDLGYECLQCYGGESYKTPVLNHLAQNGIRFDYCFSQPLCTPSRVQLMTGRYNFRNYHMFGYLDSKETTIGHMLKNAGYATCIAGKWQLGNGIEGPFNAGFDEYCLWQIYNNIAGQDVRGSRYADPKLYKNGRSMQNTTGKYGPDIVSDYILDFIERKKDEPFFVYYPMILTHDPFEPTPDSPDWSTKRNNKDKNYFADMVTYMDKIVGKIIKKLDETGLREKTLVLFTSDNGTNRGIQSRFHGKTFNGGKSLMTNAGTHVPLIANCPGTVPAGKVSEDLIDFSDFVPTLLDLAGATAPATIKIDGQSFAPQLRGQKGRLREWIYFYYWGNGRDHQKVRQAVQNREFKLYDNDDFYNIIDDPEEKTPLSQENLNGDSAAVRLQFLQVLKTIK